MKAFLTGSVFAIAALGLAAPTMAQETEAQTAERRASTGGHGKQDFIKSYDVDGDGKVSMEEFLAERAEIHKTYDLDGDGKVTQTEYVEDYQYRLDQELAARRANSLRQAHFRFGILDSDDDGEMTLNELHESGNRTFSRLDTNGDGIIDEADTADTF